MLAATLTMAPIDSLRLASRNKTDRTAQAATLKSLGRAAHNLLLQFILKLADTPRTHRIAPRQCPRMPAAPWCDRGGRPLAPQAERGWVRMIFQRDQNVSGLGEPANLA
jgi:hypothetical protein